jgi:uncharacterized membrane protein YbhN (UPF0104 family)
MIKNQHSKWKFFIRLSGTILSIVLLAYLFYSVGLQELLASLKNLTSGRIVMVIILIFISRLATFGRWHVLLQIESIKVNWKDSLRLTFAGLFAANFLPTTIGGDVVRLAGAMRLGIGGSLAAASLMVDRLIGMAGMAMVAPLGLAPVLRNLEKITSFSNHPMIFSGGFFMNNKIMIKIKAAFRKIITSFAFWIHHPRYLLLALFFTFIHMLCTFLIVDVLVVGMQESISFWKIAGLWSLTYFITLIPISINGLGLQEVSFINLFTIFGGISDPTGLSIALIMRVLMLVGSIPGAFFVSSILSGDTYTKISEENPLVLE